MGQTRGRARAHTTAICVSQDSAAQSASAGVKVNLCQGGQGVHSSCGEVRSCGTMRCWLCLLPVLLLAIASGQDSRDRIRRPQLRVRPEQEESEVEETGEAGEKAGRQLSRDRDRTRSRIRRPQRRRPVETQESEFGGELVQQEELPAERPRFVPSRGGLASFDRDPDRFKPDTAQSSNSINSISTSTGDSQYKGLFRHPVLAGGYG